MISATSFTGNPQHVESPAPLGPLLDIPRDILPNILSRLSGPSLLDLARTCKQFPIDNKQDLLKDWASRELIDISLLDGEPLWTRTLDLLASCGHVIDTDKWNPFLDVVESRQEGYAVLLQTAAFSFKAGNGKNGLGSAARSITPNFSAELYLVLEALVTGAGKDAWKARAAGAVIAGHWHHSAVLNREADWHSLARLFNKLPLAMQLKIVPLMLDEDLMNSDKVDRNFLGDCYTLNSLHVEQLHTAHLRSPSVVNLATASPKYLLSQSQMFGRASHTGCCNRTCDVLREILGSSLNHGMRIGPWREQPPETALFVLLAVRFDKKNEGVDAGLGKQLLDGGFITRHEYQDYNNFCLPGIRDRITYTKQWMALNLEKQAKDERESLCTIS